MNKRINSSDSAKLIINFFLNFNKVGFCFLCWSHLSSHRKTDCHFSLTVFRKAMIHDPDNLLQSVHSDTEPKKINLLAIK